MKTTIYIVLLSILFSACEKRRNCKKKDSNSGIISTSLTIGEGGDAGSSDRREYVIENDSIYKLCFSNTTLSQPLPEIDFSTNTLLGFYSANSCNTSYHRNVQINYDTHVYLYELQVYECKTFYKKLCFDPNWVLVPKLPAGWKVEFEKKIN